MSVITDLKQAEGPNDDWKATLPVWCMEVLDEYPESFKDWRKHFIGVENANTNVCEIRFDETLLTRVGGLSWELVYVTRQHAELIYFRRQLKKATVETDWTWVIENL